MEIANDLVPATEYRDSNAKLLSRDRGFECCGHTTVRTAAMITAFTYSIVPCIDDKYPSRVYVG